MEARKIEWEVNEKSKKCLLQVDDEKIVISIGKDELIAHRPMTNTGESPAEFFDRFMDNIIMEGDDGDSV